MGAVEVPDDAFWDQASLRAFPAQIIPVHLRLILDLCRG